jgi:hypothetical protein
VCGGSSGGDDGEAGEKEEEGKENGWRLMMPMKHTSTLRAAQVRKANANTGGKFHLPVILMYLTGESIHFEMCI